VGDVYVLAVDREEGIWSYTRDPREATGFATTREAAGVAEGKHWPRAVVMHRDNAKVIR
jgi:hypothetical protein